MSYDHRMLAGDIILSLVDTFHRRYGFLPTHLWIDREPYRLLRNLAYPTYRDWPGSATPLHLVICGIPVEER